MADFPLPDDTAQRYAELEKAYVEERWSTVLSSGQTLLTTIETSDDPQAEGLANRVRVLLGHAHLYGLAEPEVAEDYYRSVLGSRAEPELRRIAAEGLQQCQRPPAARPETEAREPATQPAIQQAVQQDAQAGDAGAANEAPAAAPSSTSSEAPFSAPSEAPINAPINATTDPFLAAVLASAAATTAAPGSAAAPATPWLADLPEDFVAPAAAPAADPFAGLGSAAAAVGPTPVAPARAAAEPAGALELIASLEVEVVEEPELVEVAQADPSLAEELELELSRIRARRAATAAAAEPASEEELEEDAASFEALEELSAPPAGIGPGEEGDPFAAAISAALEGMETPAAQAAPSRATASAPDLSGEDPELVASLLRVVIRP